MRVLRVLLGVVVLGAGGAAAWYFATRLDRAVAKIESSYGIPDLGDLEWLADRSEDDRVHAVFLQQLQFAAGSPEGERALPAIARAFDHRKPQVTDDLVDGAVGAYACHAFEKSKEWIPGWDTAPRVTTALESRLLWMGKYGAFWGSHPERSFDLLAGELERRKVAVSDDLAAAMVGIYMKFGLEKARSSWIVAWESPRATTGFVRWLGELARMSPDKEVATVLDELDRRKPPASDEYIDSLLSAWALEVSPRERLGALVRALGPGVEARFRARAAASRRPDVQAAAAPLLIAAGSGGADDRVAMVLLETEKADPGPGDAWRGLPPFASPFDTVLQDEKRPSDEVVAALVALGKDASPAIADRLETKSRSVANACARALATLDPGALVGAAEKHMDIYDPAAVGLARALEAVRNPEPSIRSLASSQAEEATMAERSTIARLWPRVEALAECLRALEGVGFLAAEGAPGTDRIDLCLMRALSSPDEALAKYAASLLKKRLDRAKFVDTLFRFLARKGEFNQTEIDVYEGALVEWGTAASADIVRSLERLLAEAGGVPMRVFWIHKVIALRCLGSVGDEGAYDILTKYAPDPQSFTYVRTEKNIATGAVKEQRQEVSFRELCERALASIAARTGKPAPAAR